MAFLQIRSFRSRVAVLSARGAATACRFLLCCQMKMDEIRPRSISCVAVVVIRKSICCIWETFPTLYFFFPVCYWRPMGSKSWVSGIPKEERRPVFGTRQYTKFFLSSQNFSPPFSLHSLSLSFSFCVCVCPRPVSVYSDGKRRLSFATLVNDSFSFSLCPSYTFSHRLR